MPPCPQGSYARDTRELFNGTRLKLLLTVNPISQRQHLKRPAESALRSLDIFGEGITVTATASEALDSLFLRVGVMQD